MAEQRKKSASLLLRAEGKTVSLELFPSVQWPEENGEEGLFRVRINDVWHSPTGKYSFLTRSAVGELVAALLAKGEPSQDEPAPRLPLHADVRVHLDESPYSCAGSVKVEPYQKRDGRWYAQVWMYGKGIRELCCCDLTLIRVRR